MDALRGYVLVQLDIREVGGLRGRVTFFVSILQ